MILNNKSSIMSTFIAKTFVMGNRCCRSFPRFFCDRWAAPSTKIKRDTLKVTLVEDGSLLPFAVGSADRDRKMICERASWRQVSSGAILKSIDNVFEFTAKYDSYEHFENDKHCYHAVAYNVQCIGGSVYKMSQDLKESHPCLSVEWDISWSMIIIR